MTEGKDTPKPHPRIRRSLPEWSDQVSIICVNLELPAEPLVMCENYCYVSTEVCDGRRLLSERNPQQNLPQS